MNDVIFAAAAWNPHLEVTDTSTALNMILSNTLWSKEIADWVSQVIRLQRLLLIYGGNPNSVDVVRKNGQAYIEGSAPDSLELVFI